MNASLTTHSLHMNLSTCPISRCTNPTAHCHLSSWTILILNSTQFTRIQWRGIVFSGLLDCEFVKKCLVNEIGYLWYYFSVSSLALVPFPLASPFCRPLATFSLILVHIDSIWWLWNEQKIGGVDLTAVMSELIYVQNPKHLPLCRDDLLAPKVTTAQDLSLWFGSNIPSKQEKTKLICKHCYLHSNLLPWGLQSEIKAPEDFIYLLEGILLFGARRSKNRCVQPDKPQGIMRLCFLSINSPSDAKLNRLKLGNSSPDCGSAILWQYF